jgi:hypothetical protein
MLTAVRFKAGPGLIVQFTQFKAGEFFFFENDRLVSVKERIITEFINNAEKNIFLVLSAMKLPFIFVLSLLRSKIRLR